MKKIETSLAGVFILEPHVFNDARGFFLETYNQRTMAESGITEGFVQDNHSFSAHDAGNIPDLVAKLDQFVAAHSFDGVDIDIEDPGNLGQNYSRFVDQVVTTLRPQGKLVRVVLGEVLDVAVDLRKKSATFGKWEATRLSGDNKRSLWIPAGLAHGFRVLSDGAHVLYKATDFYSPELERTIAWDDPDLKIDWKLPGEPVVSAKDRQGTLFRDAEKFE